MRPNHEDSTNTALEAFERGYQPVPILNGAKRPYGASWPHLRWESAEQVETSFTKWSEEGAGGIGLLLGEPSGGLIDIDLDHPKSLRMQDYFLPPSPMVTERASRPRSHRWYQVTGPVPSTRRYKMPDGAVSVELRSNGAQTVIPPSVHPDNEEYLWGGDPWGGEPGPARVDGHKLAIQVALLGLGAVLIDAWPKQGSRHETYLALAGGLLRYGDGVHPYWERNLPVLIAALADATNDEDGPEARVKEVMGTTVGKLREGGKATGFPRLAELIGVDHAELARRMAREVESLGGFTADGPAKTTSPDAPALTVRDEPDEDELPSTLPPQFRNPLEERVSSWDAVDLEPYLSGQITLPEPSVLVREDGQGLFYPGRVNSLFGKSESAKSWIALIACVQEMAKGERVVYLDLEDEPAGTLSRVRALGASDEDIKRQFVYVHPEGPLAEMQRYRYGDGATDDGRASSDRFKAMLGQYDPTLIIADGMTVLYGLHGHDTNEATATDVITNWLKTMTRGSRSTVVVIDHTGKTGGAGSAPIGAHHKIAMVQGSAIRADAMQRPMRGGIGTVRLVVFKDRPGAVREASSKGGDEQVAGTVTLDSRVEGITRFKIEAPVVGDVVIGDSDGMDEELGRLARNHEVQDKVLALFAGDLAFTLTTTQAVNETGEKADDIRTAWTQLKNEKSVVQVGSGRWTTYRLADPSKGEA